MSQICKRCGERIYGMECEACNNIDELARLRAENAALRANGYVLAMRLMQSDVTLDDRERSAMDAFITTENIAAAIGVAKDD